MPQPAVRVLTQHIPILAPRSCWWCLRLHFQPAFEAHPARPARSTAHSADSACLPPAFPGPCQQCRSVACSDCATCRRIPVILAPRPVTGRRVLVQRTGRPQQLAAVGRAVLSDSGCCHVTYSAGWTQIVQNATPVHILSCLRFPFFLFPTIILSKSKIIDIDSAMRRGFFLEHLRGRRC
jgi:hypothetical protein